jgi:hypothetical protein
MATGKFAQMPLAALIGLGTLAGFVRADDGKTPGATLPPPRAVVGDQEGIVVTPQLEGQSAGAEAQQHPFGQGIKDYFQKHGWCCYSSHNSFTCGTLKSECIFIFGSCRDFFGEPCLKGPPASGDLAVYGNGTSRRCRNCAP